MKLLFQLISLVIILSVLASCASSPPPTQKTSTGSWYQVISGDTLYSIAWRYGLDYKKLASWNRIAVNSIIKPGQRLKLFQPGSIKIAQPATEPSKTTQATESKLLTESAQPTVTSAVPSRWIWPVSGIVLNTFSANKVDRRGIDIAGKLGQPVYAMADGKVVYSGNGLSGYGNLIIIKHSDIYLSAYAYCQQRLVKEGMWVKAGTVIATMGQHKTTTARLHFEIRKNGEPVDPLKYLPKR
jgi:lipoprotein NlpD